MEPIQAKIADLTGRRAGALTEVLEMLSAGTDASGNSPQADGSFSGPIVNSLNYKEKVLGQINDMERMLCSGAFTDAMGVEEKLHLIGMLMTNAKGNARFMGDTGKELIGHAWELFKMAWDLANEQFKITEGLSKKVGLDKVSDSLAKIGMKIDLGIWSKVTGTDRKTGTKRIIIDFIRKNVLSSDAPNKTRASVGYYRIMGEYGKALSGLVFEQLTDGIADALSDMNPVPDQVVEALKKKYYAGLRGEVDKLLAQSPAKVHAVYGRLQPALHDRSTEIRSYYQSVGETRFSTEIYKAQWDLFRESVIKGGVISYDLLKLNWHKIKDHLKALENFNKITDAAYTTTNLGVEIYRYHYLWCDARSAFDFVNRSIDQGSLVTTTLAEPEISFNLFNGAYAATPTNYSSIPGMAGISGLNFSLKNGAFPVVDINKAIDAGTAYNQWVQADDKRKAYLTGFNPSTVGATYKSALEYENQLANLLIDALVYAEDKSASNRESYNASALALKKSATALSESGDKATAEMDKIPENIPVPVFDDEATSSTESWKNPLYLKIGGGILLTALVLVLTMIIILRRRKHRSRLVQPVIQANTSLIPPIPVSAPKVSQTQPSDLNTSANPTSDIQHPTFNTPNPTSDTQHPTSKIITPKFCPQCGAAFKPGAKFCGKCGFKTI
jgi:ribosomal protein L40E